MDAPAAKPRRPLVRFPIMTVPSARIPRPPPSQPSQPAQPHVQVPLLLPSHSSAHVQHNTVASVAAAASAAVATTAAASSSPSTSAQSAGGQHGQLGHLGQSKQPPKQPRQSKPDKHPKHPRFRLTFTHAVLLLAAFIAIFVLLPTSWHDGPTSWLPPLTTPLKPEAAALAAAAAPPPQPQSQPPPLPATAPLANREPPPPFNAKGADPPPNLRQCGHIMLFTAARHGSTWFLDSVEHCAFTQANNGTFGNLNSQTEIWNRGQNGPVRYIRTREAVDYVVNDMSLKFFPTPFKVHRHDAVRIIEGARDNGVSFVLLTRELEHAFKSLLVAQQNGQWNANSKGSGDTAAATAKDVLVNNEKKFASFRHNMLSYYESVKDELNARSIPFDVLTYDDIKVLRWIVLKHNECYVRNCNF